MAGWRQAVELAMTDEDIATSDGSFAVANRTGEPGGAGADAARLSGEPVVFCGGTKTWRPSSDGPALRRAGAGLWAVGGARRPTRDRARSRRSRRRPRPGWCRWRATRPRSTAIRTSCGRRGFWPAMRASMGRRRDTDASPIWSRARCARFSVKRKSSRTRCATILERRDAEFEQKMAEVLCVYREVQILKKAAAKVEEIGQAGSDRLLRREAGHPGHRDDSAGFAARAWRPCDLRARS